MSIQLRCKFQSDIGSRPIQSVSPLVLLGHTKWDEDEDEDEDDEDDDDEEDDEDEDEDG